MSSRAYFNSSSGTGLKSLYKCDNLTARAPEKKGTEDNLKIFFVLILMKTYDVTPH